MNKISSLLITLILLSCSPNKEQSETKHIEQIKPITEITSPTPFVGSANHSIEISVDNIILDGNNKTLIKCGNNRLNESFEDIKMLSINNFNLRVFCEDNHSFGIQFAEEEYLAIDASHNGFNWETTSLIFLNDKDKSIYIHSATSRTCKPELKNKCGENGSKTCGYSEEFKRWNKKIKQFEMIKAFDVPSRKMLPKKHSC